MTVPEHPSSQETADRLVGEWLDSDPVPSGRGAAGNQGDAPSAAQRRRVADLQLVHSLLVHAYDRDEAGRERKIQQVMRRVRAEGGLATDRPAASPSRRAARRLVPWSVGVAAAILLAVSLLPLLSPNPATAALDRMIAAVEQAGDRTYSIRMWDRKPRAGRHQRRPRGAPDPRKAKLDGARLYLRGRNMFVLERPASAGRTVLNGLDGRQSWLIRPRKPVLVSDDPSRFRIPMPEELADMLSLDIGTTLRRIRDGYDVKHLGDDSLGDSTDRACTHLRAEKQDRHARGPKVIEIWSHPDSGLLRRIVFENVKVQGRLTPSHIVIDLLSDRPLPVDWFTHSAHHPPDASVEKAL